MALSETNIDLLCEILDVTPSEMAYQIDYLGTNLTSTIQTAIEAQIALWTAGVGTETVKLHPTESNKGVETMPGADRALIRNAIAIRLERRDWMSGGSTTRLQRG